MAQHDLVITPRDPILVRDGRPFSAEASAVAQSLPWPLPSTVAGALRTHFGQLAHVDWHADGPQRVMEEVRVSGPLPLVRDHASAAWTVYYPAPLDAVLMQNGTRARLQPLTDYATGAGCDLPRGLRPMTTGASGKPADGHAFWSLTDAVAWLCGASPECVTRAVALPDRETRTHVKVDPATYASEKGKLFSVAYLALNDVPSPERPALALLVRVEGALVPEGCDSAMLPLGGERRVALLQTVPAWPAMPAAMLGLRDSVQNSGRLKIQLVTPALFAGGWRPSWLQETANGFEGAWPGADGLRLRLVSAAIGTRQAVSGWNMIRTAAGRAERGPKAARYLVPAGSVYCFEIIAGQLDGAFWRRLWLCSICDDPIDQHTGYGLALPGIWDYASEVN